MRHHLCKVLLSLLLLAVANAAQGQSEDVGRSTGDGVVAPLGFHLSPTTSIEFRALAGFAYTYSNPSISRVESQYMRFSVGLTSGKWLAFLGVDVAQSDLLSTNNPERNLLSHAFIQYAFEKNTTLSIGRVQDIAQESIQAALEDEWTACRPRIISDIIGADFSYAAQLRVDADLFGRTVHVGFQIGGTDADWDQRKNFDGISSQGSITLGLDENSEISGMIQFDSHVGTTVFGIGTLLHPMKGLGIRGTVLADTGRVFGGYLQGVYEIGQLALFSQIDFLDRADRPNSSIVSFGLRYTPFTEYRRTHLTLQIDTALAGGPESPKEALWTKVQIASW